MYNIFVYGTLKKGGCNHHFLKDSEFVKNDVLKDHSIYVPDLFNFPLLLEDEGGKVHGEIYKIDDNTLANLDMLESEGSLYNRINKDELEKVSKDLANASLQVNLDSNLPFCFLTK